jgi:hypothetical protein
MSFFFPRKSSGQLTKKKKCGGGCGEGSDALMDESDKKVENGADGPLRLPVMIVSSKPVTSATLGPPFNLHILTYDDVQRFFN